MDLFDSISDFIYANTLECIICIIIIVTLFLVLREARCWYWKIDENISMLNQQINALLQIIDRQDEEISILRKIYSKMDQGNSDNVSKALEEAASTEEVDPSDS